jgi:hypothetical protein
VWYAQHHLLFTFYHVAAEIKKLKKSSAESAVVVAQCAVPLLVGGARTLLPDATIAVAVAAGACLCVCVCARARGGCGYVGDHVI